jgi:hypothetical protein
MKLKFSHFLTEAQIQQLVANQTSQIQATIQSFKNTSNNQVSQIISNYTACLGTPLNSNSVSCGATALSQVTNAANTVSTGLPSATQIISQLSSVSQFGSLLLGIPIQIVQVDLALAKCLLQALPATG